MARLKGTVEFTGSLGNITAYTMRGSDKIILRARGGRAGKKLRKTTALPKRAN
ncbi:MAG TPA: hypothetical protein VHO90_18030 [Bacteroidales bacterium]|nr:hypothetical protein [Bacteroidales bacterium]